MWDFSSVADSPRLCDLLSREPFQRKITIASGAYFILWCDSLRQGLAGEGDFSPLQLTSVPGGSRTMNKQLKLALLGSCLIAVAACAAPNREPDLSNISSNVAKTREGDFGEFLSNTVEAEDKAREAEEIHGQISQHPAYLYTNLPLRQRGVKLSEEAVEHRRKAEEAFNRILDPIRARLAYLESLHVPQDVGSKTSAVYFNTGSSKIRDGESAAIEEAANFLSQYPIAHVEIAAYTDTQGSKGANKELARRRANSVLEALKKMGAPISASVTVNAVGEPEGQPDNQENQEYRRVDIMVSPHGTYNKGQ